MKVININGTEVDFTAAVNLMDDETRENIHLELPSTASEQEFFTAYEKEHIRKFGEEWELSKANPTF